MEWQELSYGNFWITSHSGASHITLNINANTTALTLDYQDNGSGFSTTEQRSGLGMTNMQSRISSIGGAIEVSDESTGHFFANIKLPLHAKNE